MSDLLATVNHHIRGCPFACFLRLLCSLSFIIALNIAAFHQAEVSRALYILLLAATGLVAMLMLAVNSNCRVRLSEDDTS